MEWKSEIVDISIILFSLYDFHLRPVNKYSLKIKLSQIFSISVHVLSQNIDVLDREKGLISGGFLLESL